MVVASCMVLYGVCCDLVVLTCSCREVRVRLCCVVLCCREVRIRLCCVVLCCVVV